MSDDRRNLATLKARLEAALHENARLRLRLKLIDACTDRKCHLCLRCLAAAQDED